MKSTRRSTRMSRLQNFAIEPPALRPAFRLFFRLSTCDREPEKSQLQNFAFKIFRDARNFLMKNDQKIVF